MIVSYRSLPARRRVQYDRMVVNVRTYARRGWWLVTETLVGYLLVIWVDRRHVPAGVGHVTVPWVPGGGGRCCC